MKKYPKYKKVLFCTDFSENADDGLLYILHVMPYDSNQAYAESFITTEDVEKIKKAVEEDVANNYKERYEKKIENGIAYEFITKSGREDEEIIGFAQKEKVDLIVIGTHGRTGIERVFFGSVAEKVLRHSPFPVFIIPCKKKRERS